MPLETATRRLIAVEREESSSANSLPSRSTHGFGFTGKMFITTGWPADDGGSSPGADEQHRAGASRASAEDERRTVIDDRSRCRVGRHEADAPAPAAARCNSSSVNNRRSRNFNTE